MPGLAAGACAVPARVKQGAREPVRQAVPPGFFFYYTPKTGEVNEGAVLSARGRP